MNEHNRNVVTGRVAGCLQSCHLHTYFKSRYYIGIGIAIWDEIALFLSNIRMMSISHNFNIRICLLILLWQYVKGIAKGMVWVEYITYSLWDW